MIRHGVYPTTLGELLLTAEGDALTGLYFPDHRYPPAPEMLGEDLGFEPEDAVLAETARQLREYLAGERTEFDLQLAPNGDEFSQQVWNLLRDIPYGETTTYGELAVTLGNRALAQRVGQSVGHNPVCIIIPCHRVLGSDGSLTGYAGGLDRKRALLELEEPEPATAGRLF
ncbi:methylated-DNA--[protein]-cysteine S-methyltransferase [Leucobacter denitrificans]|uniref:Methylated-DNA--protein-cysteine methyltransferase n=1 Tax=Leucobacter denitrificans TaxID=683042 RepID=A0A7G9S221_9MICO|nr:methylated-DNA--[protein]-cysteine S-methyltransferase [Leucobacter denitrificans]QNN61896.1 methylated-DNA--[protein]-cysteine S-methyltransferase [Leucobacter denitrificans]